MLSMSLVDQILQVMTPAEWGRPIEVDEKWIGFVDENVKASMELCYSSIKSCGSILAWLTWQYNQQYYQAVMLRILFLTVPAIGQGLPRSQPTEATGPLGPIS